MKTNELIKYFEYEGHEILSCSHLSKNNGYYSLVATVGYWEDN